MRLYFHSPSNDATFAHVECTSKRKPSIPPEQDEYWLVMEHAGMGIYRCTLHRKCLCFRPLHFSSFCLRQRSEQFAVDVYWMLRSIQTLFKADCHLTKLFVAFIRTCFKWRTVDALKYLYNKERNDQKTRQFTIFHVPSYTLFFCPSEIMRPFYDQKKVFNTT